MDRCDVTGAMMSCADAVVMAPCDVTMTSSRRDVTMTCSRRPAGALIVPARHAVIASLTSITQNCQCCAPGPSRPSGPLLPLLLTSSYWLMSAVRRVRLRSSSEYEHRHGRRIQRRPQNDIHIISLQRKKDSTVNCKDPSRSMGLL